MTTHVYTTIYRVFREDTKRHLEYLSFHRTVYHFTLMFIILPTVLNGLLVTKNSTMYQVLM